MNRQLTGQTNVTWRYAHCRFDCTQANKEGWDFGSQIRCLDGSPLLHSDAEAVEFVMAEAQKGSAYHLTAIMFHTGAPEEAFLSILRPFQAPTPCPATPKPEQVPQKGRETRRLVAYAHHVGINDPIGRIFCSSASVAQLVAALNEASDLGVHWTP